MRTEIVVIGAGIVGSTIARELSKYRLQILLVEKRSDVGFGSPTKGNTGLIHAGYDSNPGTIRAELCARGNALWHRIMPEIGVPFKETGSLVVAFSEDEKRHLEELRERGEENGVPLLEIIEDKRRLLETEPNLNHDAVAALFAPTAGITAPYELAIAVAENAVQNGVKLLLEAEVTDIVTKGGKIEGVSTSKGFIETSFVINAAGLEADKVSAMAGEGDFTIHPRKGEYYLLDKKLSGLVRHILFPVPTHLGKGIVVTSTVEGNVLIGPNACDIEDKNDTTTTSSGLNEVYTGALRLIPELAHHKRQIITYFSGLRPETDKEDFIIGSYDDLRGFIDVAGMRSPGLTAAPAVAEKVVDLIKQAGLDLVKKKSFNAIRQPIDHAMREQAFDRAEKLIEKDPDYGHVVCRCEHVTEAEIVDAIRRGATTLDGVKFRTRSGMGRCQGGFCTPHILKILSRELGVPLTEVTKRGADSWLFLCDAKKLLEERS